MRPLKDNQFAADATDGMRTEAIDDLVGADRLTRPSLDVKALVPRGQLFR